MMWHNCKAEIKIMKTDNGFIVEWETEKSRRPRSFSSRDEDDIYGNPRGVHIFETKKAAMEFITGKL